MPYHISPDVIIDGTLYTLLAFSVVTWTVILFKIWQFTKNSFYNRGFNTGILGRGQSGAGKNLARRDSQRPGSAHCPARLCMDG